MPFEFVNNAAIDRKARKLIRSHVAKGKNVGKTRPLRRKHHALGVKIIAPIRNTKSVGDAQDSGKDEAIPAIERQVGDGLSVLPLPTQLTPRSRGLFQKVFSFVSGPLYPPEISNAIDSAGAATMWIQYMFLDEAYFHCSVAMTVAAVNPLLVKQEDSIEAMRHLSDTFRLVNEKLSGNEALSDTTMAVLVVMTQHERLRAQYCQGLVHFEGLQRMVELRGGMSQLMRQKPGLAQKIFRADLEFALHLGGPTRFSVEDVPGHASISWLRSRFRQNQKRHFCDSHLFRQLSINLQSVLLDIMSLAWLLNNNDGHAAKLDGYTFHDILILIGYRLINISPLLGPQPASHLENSLHLSLTAFMTTFLLGLGLQVQEFPLLSKLARSAAQGHFDEDEETQEVLLWILFIGRASIFRQPDDVWLIPKITETMLSLNLHTWEDMCRTLSKFPCVNALHDKSGQALWHRSRSHYHTPGDHPTDCNNEFSSLL